MYPAEAAPCASAISGPILKIPVATCRASTSSAAFSHDIIVHEATHALVDRLRPFYREATNVDVYAFHEGFADAIALFQDFSLPDLSAHDLRPVAVVIQWPQAPTCRPRAALSATQALPPLGRCGC